MISALEQEGFVTSLGRAEPDGDVRPDRELHRRRRVSGADHRLRRDHRGLPTITVEFKTFGVSLAFTPTIIDAQPS